MTELQVWVAMVMGFMLLFLTICLTFHFKMYKLEKRK